jgi:adenylate kinase
LTHSVKGVVQHHVVYLTGAPATGKSSLGRALAQRVENLAVFEYGERLREHLSQRTGEHLTQEILRGESAAIASAEDIQVMDQALLTFVARQRQESHVLIDTHPVTKEVFGFRITAFSLAEITELAPTLICVLYTEPDVVVSRIADSPGGRPRPTEWEASYHSNLQAMVAVSYATQLGVPVYLFDSARPSSELAEDIGRRIEGRVGHGRGRE